MTSHNFPSRAAAKAAAKWTTALGVAEPRDSLSPERTILDLAESAFGLYELEWQGIGVSGIEHWHWPFTELSDGGEFGGSQPWTVLLREAVKLARP